MFHDVSLCFMTFRDTSWYLIKIPDVSTLFHQIRDDAYRISVEFGDSWFFLVSHNPLTKAPRMAHWKAQREGRRSSPRASLGAHDQKAVKMKWCTTNEFFLKKRVFLFFLGHYIGQNRNVFFLKFRFGNRLRSWEVRMSQRHLIDSAKHCVRFARNFLGFRRGWRRWRRRQETICKQERL